MKKFHNFHLVTPSPWPIIGSIMSFNMVGGTLMMMHTMSKTIMLSTMISLAVMFTWWKDIFSESSMEGEHSKKNVITLKTGMILFIISEIFLFISLFWAFFHSSFSPSVEMGTSWPPKTIKTFSKEEIPLLNTIILISSGGTLTMAHHMMMKKMMKSANKMMMITIMLGILFTTLQVFEYFSAKFSMSDSVFGSSFFMATGFHGAHVIIGTIFLTTCMMQMKKMKSTFSQFISFEASAWYWHFVDVVWLFLMTSIYWWGA